MHEGKSERGLAIDHLTSKCVKFCPGTDWVAVGPQLGLLQVQQTLVKIVCVLQGKSECGGGMQGHSTG